MMRIPPDNAATFSANQAEDSPKARAKIWPLNETIDEVDGILFHCLCSDRSSTGI
jgi:hypothetical protein